MANNMTLHLRVWRQKDAKASGAFATYTLKDVSPNMSFLEMLDLLNEQLLQKREAAVEFDSDCREGICGSCSCMINGQAHGPELGTATCQLYMRKFKDGDTIVIEPWRATAFPLVRDLVTDRGALDRVIAAGGYTSVKVGPHPDANVNLVPKDDAEKAMDAAACIGCGACVAACPNASAALFTAAKITQMSLLPQGRVEAHRRAYRMTQQMDQEGFGHCTNIGECQSACPKSISIDTIATMRREYMKALVKS
jgi:succinate dehydrogenase / fumarate reductase, iron-sulfur subunit